MSARVNLLPGEVAERNRQRRNAILLGLGGVALVALLVFGYIVQLNRVDDAQQRLTEVEQRLSTAQAELSELNEFRELRDRAESATALLQTALGDEVSIAGILQDVAAVMPSDAELGSISISIGEGAQEAGDLRETVGSLLVGGRSLRGHAPGVERFLLSFDKIASFSDVFFTGSTIDEEGVSSFNAEIDLGPEIRTGRYRDGLPEELR